MDNKELINAKVEELSILPEKWAWINISSVAKVTGGLTKNQSKMKLEKIVPYLRVANVYANEIRLDEVLEIGINESEWKRVKLEKEDLLIVEGNGSLEQVGRVAIWNGEIENCAHQNHLIKIRFDELVIPKFALYWLLSLDGRRAIMQLASSSSGLHTLSMSKVSSLPMPLCSLQEMNIIVEIIETLFEKIDRLEQEYQKAMKFLDRLEQSTLAKAFRGELVSQDPNDEPASILLERIQKERESQQKPKKRQLSLFKEK
jgi:type I restriction enzyme S subunit